MKKDKNKYKTKNLDKSNYALQDKNSDKNTEYENNTKKVVYFSDELNDDFASNKIKTKPLKENFKYVKRGPFWTFAAWFMYYIIAVPFGSILCYIKFRLKVKNRKVLKENRKKGYFLYANHTQNAPDAFLPALSLYPKRNYVMVHEDAVSVRGLKNLVLMLGGIPVANTMNNVRLMKECIEKRIKNKHTVTIYPEAHVWPYCNFIRNFKSASFRYPVELNSPVYCSTMVYRERKGKNKKPRAIIYIDGPFYPDKTLNKKEAIEKLRNEVFNTMNSRAHTPDNYEYIKYMKKED